MICSTGKLKQDERSVYDVSMMRNRCIILATALLSCTSICCAQILAETSMDEEQHRYRLVKHRSHVTKMRDASEVVEATRRNHGYDGEIFICTCKYDDYVNDDINMDNFHYDDDGWGRDNDGWGRIFYRHLEEHESWEERKDEESSEAGLINNTAVESEGRQHSMSHSLFNVFDLDFSEQPSTQQGQLNVFDLDFNEHVVGGNMTIVAAKRKGEHKKNEWSNDRYGRGHKKGGK